MKELADHSFNVHELTHKRRGQKERGREVESNSDATTEKELFMILHILLGSVCKVNSSP